MTGSPGHIELERAIDSIRIGSRHRTDFGDIDELADSIKRQGLLQPITVTPEGVLVCGARRLAALRQLGVRRLNVWVRSGVSDRLTQLLAEQDDDAMHKPLSPTESATLYREVKILLAEDARRRQEATRFGSPSTLSGSNGAAKMAGPSSSSDGYSRTKAALLVTGRRSYTTLERISELQRLASDVGLDESVRARAAAELALIDDGGAVEPAHRRMNEELAQTEHDRRSKRTRQRVSIHPATSLNATARAEDAEHDDGEVELEQIAREALARVRTTGRDKRQQPASRPIDMGQSAKLPARSFIFIWDDMREWWLRYDVAEVADKLTNGQWEQFEATLSGTIAFADRVRSLRSGEEPHGGTSSERCTLQRTQLIALADRSPECASPTDAA
jgi:ParB family transcriptional regulator, chromosome partitioning protein